RATSAGALHCEARCAALAQHRLSEDRCCRSSSRGLPHPFFLIVMLTPAPGVRAGSLERVEHVPYQALNRLIENRKENEWSAVSSLSDESRKIFRQGGGTPLK